MQPSSPDLFYSAKRRLDRANNRISRLKDIVIAFVKKNPYAATQYMDTDGVTKVHAIKFTDRLDPVCEDIAAEALLALRACLDQAAYATAVAAGKSKPTQTRFPIAGSATDLQNLLKGGICKHVPQDIVTFFCGLKPYKGGNDTLWTMNHMRNAIHTTFAPNGVVAGFNSITFLGGTPGFSGRMKGLNIVDPLRWDREKNEIAIFRADPGAHYPDIKIDFRFLISFSDVVLNGSKDAVAILSAMALEVQRVLLGTEEECHRLKLI